jgi:hypothetical protein
MKQDTDGCRQHQPFIVSKPRDICQLEIGNIEEVFPFLIRWFVSFRGRRIVGNNGDIFVVLSLAPTNWVPFKADVATVCWKRLTGGHI